MMGGLYFSRYVGLLVDLSDELIIWLQTALQSSLFPSYNSFALIVGTILGGFLAWHAVQAFIVWFKDRYPAWNHIQQVVLAMIFLLMMRGAMPLANGGSFFGMSYGSVTAPLSEDALQKMVNGVKAVDVVVAWNKGLDEARKKKTDRILQAMANTNPDMAKAYQKKMQEIPGSMEDEGGMWSKVKEAWLAAKLSTQAGVFNVGGSIVKAAFTRLAFIVGSYALSLAYIGVAIYSVRTLLLFALYLKIAVWLGLYLFPGMIGLAFWPATRSFAVQAVKNIIILTIMSTALTQLTGAVFSQKNITNYVALAMKDSPTGTLAEKVTKGDILMLMASAEARDSLKRNLTTEDTAYFMGMDFGDFYNSGLAVWRVIIVIWLLMTMLQKVYDAIQGALDGHWDVMGEYKGVKHG